MSWTWFAEVIPIQLGATQQQLIVRGKSTKPKRRKVHPFHWWVRKHRAEGDYEDYLTKENKSFLLEEAQKTYLGKDLSCYFTRPANAAL